MNLRLPIFNFIFKCSITLLDLITLTILGERYKLWSSSLWSLLHSTFSSLLGPNIRLRILFSNTPRLHSSLIKYSAAKLNLKSLYYLKAYKNRNIGTLKNVTIELPKNTTSHFKNIQIPSVLKATFWSKILIVYLDMVSHLTFDDVGLT